MHLLVDIVVERRHISAGRDFYWPRQYQFVRKYVRACKVCQQVKSGPTLRAPLQPLPIPVECWESVSMDFVFGFPVDPHKNTGILVFVNRFCKMVHLVAVPESTNASTCARVFIDTPVFMGCLVKSSPIEAHGSLLDSGDPCSKHSERAFRCRPLTILKQMVRQNVQTAFLRKSFGVMSIRLQLERILANGGIRHQQLGACIDDAYTFLREWLAPPTPIHVLRM